MFGKVIEGLDVMKEIEKQGSQSGKTANDVVIQDWLVIFKLKFET